MSHAERCPVCKGSGRITPRHDHLSTTPAPTPASCHGCDGKGWVVVPDMAGNTDDIDHLFGLSEELSASATSVVDKGQRAARMDITDEQLAFMSGAEPANDIHVVLPLLRAGLMQTNPNAPPMFLRTPEGDALLSERGYKPVPRRVSGMVTFPASASGDTPIDDGTEHIGSDSPEPPEPLGLCGHLIDEFGNDWTARPQTCPPGKWETWRTSPQPVATCPGIVTIDDDDFLRLTPLDDEGRSMMEAARERSKQESADHDSDSDTT